MTSAERGRRLITRSLAANPAPQPRTPGSHLGGQGSTGYHVTRMVPAEKDNAARAAAVLCAAAWALMGAAGCSRASSGPAASRPARQAGSLRVVVMDPLARELSCDCLPGYAQRRYGKLCEYLAGRLGRAVGVTFAEYLEPAHVRGADAAHLVIAQQSLALSDANALRITLRPLARLTDRDGNTTLRGHFLVRAGDRAAGLSDLTGCRLLLGSEEFAESHFAALAALAAAGVDRPAGTRTEPAYLNRALAVVEKTADAAVVPSWSLRKMFDTGKVERAWVKDVGRTAPVPFVTVYATGALGDRQAADVRAALLAARSEPALLKALESRDGFVRLTGASGR